MNKPLGICCGLSFYSRSEWAEHQRQHRIDKAGIEPAPTPKKEKVVSNIKSQGEMVVVETEDNQYLGFVEERDGAVLIRNGLRGHPVTLQRADIESIVPAQGHPYVEYL